MNTFAKNIIYIFLSDSNTNYLKGRLIDFFKNNGEVAEYVESDMRRRQYAFSGRISRELSVSDPMEGTSIMDQVMSYNTQFLRELTKDIEADIMPNLTPRYTVSETKQCNGRSSAIANEKNMARLSPDDVLKSWNDNPASLHQYRDDNQGDFKATDRNYYNNKCYNPYYDKPAEYCAIASGTSRYCGNATSNWGLKKYDTYRDPRDVYKMPPQSLTATSTHIPQNPSASIFQKSRDYKEGFNGGRQSGQPNQNGGIKIDFSDQSEVGTSSYYDRQFNTLHMNALNRDPQKHTLQPFGYATAASDERLLSRRIFRNNEAGVENGIPRYEVRLQRRNLDRDNGETFADTQYDFIQRGHDMGDLIRRTNSKVKINDTKGYDNSMTDKLKYSGLFNDF
jgi:hypothetical protein